ncbi:MAG: PEP-CTERM sorting domain-containing protein [Verrucomicrobiota bacterium]|nr:PEP-CTERM sorting domain-containing protein [Verrucomicrobiota bacterium]
MKIPSILLILAAVPFVNGAVVTYPSLNGILDNSGTQTGPVSIDAAHRFVDPDSGTPVAGIERYYGGTINLDVTTDWGIEGEVTFFRSDASEAFKLRLNEGGGSTWQLSRGGASANLGIGGNTSFDYVIKVSDKDWNLVNVDIFLNANANNVTEGTPDFTIDTAVGSTPLDAIAFKRTGWGNNGAFTLANSFSSTVWTPVSSVVPEPSTYAALAGLAILGFTWYRRQK